jgi:hypothetical protein
MESKLEVKREGKKKEKQRDTNVGNGRATL